MAAKTLNALFFGGGYFLFWKKGSLEGLLHLKYTLNKCVGRSQFVF
ncbi:MAG: hypothetical protein IJ407_04400 [Clostridia bacterium]|nr:hypothetical protein [Clostridia bacterium]